ncbi:MAG TPA: S9 family peptidase [Acidimicrobiia bacterium]
MSGQTPPRAPRRPTVLRHGTHARVDDWYWLRERDDPDVLAYLKAENEYTDAGFASTADLRARIFGEIKARVRETDVSAPVRRGDWEYYSRTIEGRDYAVHCRRPATGQPVPDPDALPGTPAGEQVVLDENVLAAAHEYFALRGLAIAPGQAVVAYSIDVDGGERATLRFREIGADTDLSDEVADVYYGLAWANDDRTLFYVRTDAAVRPHQVWRHVLSTPVGDDVLVLQEDDERFYLSIHRARSGSVIVVTAASKLTTEVHLLDANTPTEPPRCVAAREHGLEYHVEHHADPERGDRIFVVTNAGGVEGFRLMVAPAHSSARDEWQDVLPPRPDVRIADVDAFATHLVVSERAAGLEQLRVVPIVDGEVRLEDAHLIEMPEDVYSAWVGANAEFTSPALRYGYTSLVAPVSDVDYDVASRARSVVKVQPVEGYDAAGFETHRVWATAPDGTAVPISIVHRRGLPRDGSAPLLLYGYGAYEVSIDPTFSITRLSLLTRGVMFAIAHVRGGGELGRRWYEHGKLDRKRNTFTDFIACAEHLVAAGYTSADRLVARGGSAGGLLMGAVANLRPELFGAVVAEVPFVDCLTTMLDETLPLTITEWEEWGDPVHDEHVYEYIGGYAPYDNVRDQPYPPMLVTAGLNDPRVQFWEPAKWVARLRATVSAPHDLFLKTELGAGHHGPSGRYEAWEEEALVLAFALAQVGITD